jgi:hypothetical protein
MVAPSPMTFASHLIRVRLWPQVGEPDFVNYWINSAWGRMWARYVKTDAVSQSNINGTFRNAEEKGRNPRFLDASTPLLGRL